MNIGWNAEDYKKNFSFVYHYGNDVLEMIDAPEKSFVVDLVCGVRFFARLILAFLFHSVILFYADFLKKIITFRGSAAYLSFCRNPLKSQFLF